MNYLLYQVIIWAKLIKSGVLKWWVWEMVG
jgi:hypothetical protein